MGKPAAFLFLVQAFLALPQESAPALHFEVASVKEVQPGATGSGTRGGPGTTDPGRITITNLSLGYLIRYAYNLQMYQFRGPAWLDTETYDVLATLPAGATKEQSRLMMRTLLTERFNLKLHRESKELPAYALTVGKHGHKLTPAKDDGTDEPEPVTPLPSNQVQPLPPMGKDGFPKMALYPGGVTQMFYRDRAKLVIVKQPIAALANMLSHSVDRPVVDRTSLQGLYDITLYWALESSSPQPASEPATGVSVFTALQQQLGLQLDPVKAAIDVYIIDAADRVPTEN